MQYKLYILSLLLLTSCSQPNTTTVDTNQEGYIMPTEYTVVVRVANPVVVAAMCRLESDIGCQIWLADGSATIWISETYKDIPHALRHEFEHIISGPQHN